MSEHGKADEARHGLIDSLKGKVKEAFGAVTGNDSLTAEGQLQQTEAHARKEANSAEAVADAEAEEGRAEATQAIVEGARARGEVNAEALAAEQAIRSDEAAQKRTAEQSGRQQIQEEQARAEQDARREVEQAQARERAQSQQAAEEVVDATAERVESGLRPAEWCTSRS